MLSYLFPQEKNVRINSISSSDYELIKKPEEKVKIIQDLFSENPGKSFVLNGAQRILIIKWHPQNENYNSNGYFSLTIKSNRKELSGWSLESYIATHTEYSGIHFVMTNGEIYTIKLNKNQVQLFGQNSWQHGPIEEWEWV